MAVDMFLDLGKVKGESIDSKHKDKIDVLSWSWGMSADSTAHMGGGSGSGKVNVQNLNFTHYVDKASPDLVKVICTHDHIDKATLIVRKGGGKPLEYIKIEMEQVSVCGITEGGSSGEERLTENITLNFRKFKYSYQQQEKDGAPGKTSEFTWDIAAHNE